MVMVAEHRKAWNKKHKLFRTALETAETTEAFYRPFYEQHGILHSADLTAGKYFSFEDEVFLELSEEKARRIPKNKEHSIAWCIWHIARIEDITMNILVAGGDQLFREEKWLKKLGISFTHTGNDMGARNVAEISAAIDLQALRAYRLAVGRRTQEIVSGLTPAELNIKVDPVRLQRLISEEAVLDEARGLLDYWGRRTYAGLILMPATRHNLVHLNESLVLKQRGA
jgi:hypothetical protein